MFDNFMQVLKEIASLIIKVNMVKSSMRGITY